MICCRGGRAEAKGRLSSESTSWSPSDHHNSAQQSRPAMAPVRHCLGFTLSTPCGQADRSRFRLPLPGPARAVQIRPLSVARQSPASLIPSDPHANSLLSLSLSDVFVPIGAMLHYGDPEWYERHVGPFRSAFRMDHKKQASLDPASSSRISFFLLVELSTRRAAGTGGR